MIVACTASPSFFWRQHPSFPLENYLCPYLMWRRLFHDVTMVWPTAGSGQNRDCLLQSPCRGCLIVIHVHAGINQHPSPHNLPPAACRFLEQALSSMSFPVPGSIHVLAPVTVPFLTYLILWCLISGTGIHFVLQLPRIHLECTFPLITSINYQTGVACLFFRSFPARCLQR